MSNHKCHTKQTANYEVKQRYIPTFVHQEIFQEAPLRPYSSRCTPTFHSTVFDTDGYNIKTIHQKNTPSNAQAKDHQQHVVYCNNSHKKRIYDINNQNNNFSASRDRWFDHTKQQIFLSIKNGQNYGYSKQRKYVDLSSDPVFTDFTYQNKCYLGKTIVQPTHCCHSINNQVEQQQSTLQTQNLPTLHENGKYIQTKQSHEPHQVVINRQNNHPHNLQVKQQPIKYVQQQKNNKQLNKKAIVLNEKQLKLKGKKIQQRPQTVQKQRTVKQRPQFTVTRKNRVHH